MDESDISALTGDALRRAFLKAANPRAVGADNGPLVVVHDDGSIRVFNDGPEPPAIEFVSIDEQAVAAMALFQRNGARFEASDSNLTVFCTIGGVMAMGWDYFEAGMRAYVLSEVQRETGK